MQIDQPMTGDLGEHMLKKRQAGGEIDLTITI
jgi:hypothetical protein